MTKLIFVVSLGLGSVLVAGEIAVGSLASPYLDTEASTNVVFNVLRNDVTAFSRAIVDGALARIGVCVVDEDNHVVQGAMVHCRLGMIDETKATNVKVETDSEGRAWIEGRTCGNYLDVMVEKDGYYRSRRKFCYVEIGQEHKVADGRWQPWGDMERVVLRKVGDPLPLVNISGFYEIPTTNRWCSFDLQKQDWVIPDGRGDVPDLKVKLDWDGKTPNKSEYCRIEIYFPGKMAGFYSAGISKDSEFKGVHHARPYESYRKSFMCARWLENGTMKTKGFGGGSILVARSRCEIDNRGQLEKANYFQIEGISVSAGWKGKAVMSTLITYNPTPNDTNLEPRR